jgi:4,5-dihydroxyphthalate decarboxylase
VNLWLRGIFKEHYGLSPEQVTWVLAEDNEGAGYTIPKTIPVEVRKGGSAIENLKNGLADAMFCTSVPEQFRKGESWIRRLFPDVQAETENLVHRSGVMPITHVLVMNKHLWERQPAIAESLYHAFVEAQRSTDTIYDDPKRISLFGAEFIGEQQRSSYGENPYSHGIALNRKVIETFVRYAHEQGYISRQIPVEELFASNTLSL